MAAARAALRAEHRAVVDLPPVAAARSAAAGTRRGRPRRTPERRRRRRADPATTTPATTRSRRLAPRTGPPAYPDRMLFDLRGKGRRRTVQVIYLSLAVLMGGGLVLFGIGGATSGGLFDAFSSDSGNTNVSSIYTKRIKTYQKPRSRSTPRTSRPGRASPARRSSRPAINGYNQATGTYTADGLKHLQVAADSWQTYLDLNPQEARRQPRVADGQRLRLQRAQRPRQVRAGTRRRDRRPRRQLRALHAARGALLHRRRRPQERARRTQRRLPSPTPRSASSSRPASPPSASRSTRPKLSSADPAERRRQGQAGG